MKKTHNSYPPRADLQFHLCFLPEKKRESECGKVNNYGESRRYIDINCTFNLSGSLTFFKRQSWGENIFLLLANYNS